MAHSEHQQQSNLEFLQVLDGWHWQTLFYNWSASPQMLKQKQLCQNAGSLNTFYDTIRYEMLF